MVVPPSERVSRMMPVLALLLLAPLAGCIDQDAQHADSDVASHGLACPDPCIRQIHTGDLWEPHIAVNPTNDAHIVVSSHDLSYRTSPRTYWHWALSHVSTDGGATWETQPLPGGPDAAPDHPLYRYNDIEDSVLAFLPDGTLLWSALALEIVAQQGIGGYVSSAALVVLRSDDGGRTFPDITIVQQESGGTLVAPAFEPQRLNRDDQDKNWITTSPDGTALLTWTRNQQNNHRCIGGHECSVTYAASSTDGGTTWSTPRVVYDETASGSAPLIRSDGGWVVALRDTHESRLVVAVSDDHDAWHIQDLGLTRKFPVLAATQDLHGERLYLAYPAGDGNDREGTQVVTLRWSDDGGHTWSDPYALHEPAHDGFTAPAIAPSTATGAIVTHWHPSANASALQATRIHNGNATTTLSLDTSPGPISSTGDYIGLAPMPDGGAYATWITRNDNEFVLKAARLTLGLHDA